LQATIAGKNKIELVLPPLLMESLLRRAQLAGISVALVVLELVEPVLTAERLDLEKIPKSSTDGIAPRGMAPKTRQDLDHHRTKISVALVQRIVFLHDTEGLTPEVIAQRIGCGQTTIRRIVAEFDASPHVRTVQQPTRTSGSKPNIPRGNFNPSPFPPRNGNHA
jgi:hypothetical protein